VRTQSEIELERYSLKALRGDFGGLTAAGEGDLPARVFEAARR
jgi:hypothetical protein